MVTSTVYTDTHKERNKKKSVHETPLPPPAVVRINIGMYDKDGGSPKKTARLNMALEMTSDRLAAV